MSIVNEILERVKLCYGVNPLPFDRLFKGNNQQADFFLKLVRERDEMIEAINVAAVSMQVMDAELQELRVDIKASGLASMMVGEKRKDAE